MDNDFSFTCIPDSNPKYNLEGMAIFRFTNASTNLTAVENYNLVSGNIYRIEFKIDEIYKALVG